MNDIILPDPLPYPDISKVDLNLLKNKFCYVLKKYPLQGLSLIIARGEYACIRLADFSGKLLQPNDVKHGKLIDNIMTNYSQRLITTMKCIGIPKAMFYFSSADVPRLVDIRLSINKFCSPGYLNDFFNKQGIPTQERVGDPVVLDDNIYTSVLNGTGIYSGKSFILKPSSFKFSMNGDECMPLYGVVN